MLTGRQTPSALTLCATLTLLAAAMQAASPSPHETETLLLSGAGTDDAVDWDFRCTFGRNCGSWTRLPVPSNWELHGFGSYNYGHDEDKADERGEYRHRFDVPTEWQGRRNWLVFEGVMTDATVRLNGTLLGPTHRGAFYAFRYEVTEHLLYGAENLLEVVVDRESSDDSVNRAERDADYWVFGGIFRPVYLESRPRQSIAELAIATHYQGTFDARVDFDFQPGETRPDRLVAHLETLDGERIGADFGALIGASDSVRLATQIRGIQPWSPEKPSLYQLVSELRWGATTVHRRTDRIGFRTIEPRDDGLFLNGQRILLRGINRHSFHPESGRATSKALSRADIELLKWLNANAVRSSHYPPDRHFLDLCDEMGLLVVDELTGWHDAYSTRTGTPLVREMVAFNRNHPSIFAWANGNEGGWNVRLDPLFALYDLQDRPVLHPDTVFGGFDTRHYPTWKELANRLDGSDRSSRGLVLPTEMLHGLYDGGHAAGLEDFWQLIEGSPRGAGGFLWALFDEAVRRRDENNRLDSDGNHGPDGLAGPFRELEASAWGVRQLWAPARLLAPVALDASFDGSLTLENRFHFTNLASTELHWELVRFPDPEDPSDTLREQIVNQGMTRPPSIAPGESGRVSLGRSIFLDRADALRVSLVDHRGRHRRTWVVPVTDARAENGLQPRNWMSVRQLSEGDLELASETVRVRISAHDGALAHWEVGGLSVPLKGPLPATWESTPESTNRSQGTSIEVFADRRSIVVTSQGPIRRLEWRLDSAGQIDLRYSLAPGSTGIGFDLPPDSVEVFHRLAEGPFRSWGNRSRGGRLGWWTTPANDTRTGVDWGGYPAMRGYHSKVRWAQLETTFGRLRIDLRSDPTRFLQLLHPSFGPDPRFTEAPLPGPQVSIQHRIPSIGTKFHPALDLRSPEASRRPAKADSAPDGRIQLQLIPPPPSPATVPPGVSSSD